MGYRWELSWDAVEHGDEGSAEDGNAAFDAFVTALHQTGCAPEPWW